MGESPDIADSGYSRRIGARLRAIRKQKRMSLQDVEAQSSQEFRASVVGAYERGERAISVPRLQRLAAFYDVPVAQMLPPDVADAASTIDLTDSSTNGSTDMSITLDLSGLHDLVGPEAEMLRRYVSMIQIQRQDFNGRMLTIRRDDVRALAAILGVPSEGAIARITDMGLAYRPA